MSGEIQNTKGTAKDLKDHKIYMQDGTANGTQSPQVGAISSIGADTVTMKTGTFETKVPLHARVQFSGDAQVYRITGRTLSAGVDEVQSLAAHPETGGTLTLTFTIPGTSSTITTAAIAFDATAATVQTAVDLAWAGSLILGKEYVAGDIAVTGGDLDSGATVFTFSGTSVAKCNWPQSTVDGALLTPGATPGAFTTTTDGTKVDSLETMTITPDLLIATSVDQAMTFLPVKLEFEVGEGEVTWTKTRNLDLRLNRGKIAGGTFKEGDEVPVEMTLGFTLKFLSSIFGADIPTAKDAFERTGPAADWITTNDEKCGPYLVDIVIEPQIECFSGDPEEDIPETLAARKFFYTSQSGTFTDSLVNVSGSCKATDLEFSRTLIV